AQTQLHLLNGKQAAFRDNAGIEDVWLLRHAGSVVTEWFVIITAHSFKTQTTCLTGTPLIPSCWTWTAPFWTCILTPISGWNTCPAVMPTNMAGRWNGPNSISIR